MYMQEANKYIKYRYQVVQTHGGKPATFRFRALHRTSRPEQKKIISLVTFVNPTPDLIMLYLDCWKPFDYRCHIKITFWHLFSHEGFFGSHFFSHWSFTLHRCLNTSLSNSLVFSNRSAASESSCSVICVDWNSTFIMRVHKSFWLLSL